MVLIRELNSIFHNSGGCWRCSAKEFIKVLDISFTVLTWNEREMNKTFSGITKISLLDCTYF